MQSYEKYTTDDTEYTDFNVAHQRNMYFAHLLTLDNYQDRLFFLAQKGSSVHNKALFVQFIWLCAQKVVPLQPFLKGYHFYTLFIIWL